MKIYYYSALISENLYKTLYNKKTKPGMQAQVFNRLIVYGLINNGIDLTCISTVPTSKFLLDKTFINIQNEDFFQYFKIINVPIVKDLYIFFKSYFKTLKALKSDADLVCVLDVLSPVSSFAASLVCKRLKRKCIGIVTDIPELFESNQLFIKMTNMTIQNCSDYIFLTEEMNKYLNKNNKPYKIIEGMSSEVIINNDKDRDKVFIYAGSLDKVNGIDKLINAFKEINTDYQLHIYGDGDYENTIIEICQKHPNIKYFGLISHQEILKKIRKASFLVNPRGSDNEMVKYSFPSKNMEYLASGTPFLCTKLPCIPDEYYAYINLFPNEKSEGIKKGIENILKTNYELLIEKAIQGQNFILNNKTCTTQTKKIIELIRG